MKTLIKLISIVSLPMIVSCSGNQKKSGMQMSLDSVENAKEAVYKLSETKPLTISEFSKTDSTRQMFADTDLNKAENNYKPKVLLSEIEFSGEKKLSK